MPSWKATERLYLNRDKTEVCRDGDTNAASLLCGIGAMVPEDACRKYRLGPFADDPAVDDDVANADGTDTIDDQHATEESEGQQSSSQSDSEDSASTDDPDDPDDPENTEGSEDSKVSEESTKPSEAPTTPRRKR